MEKVLNFQMSLFGSFVNVHPQIDLTNRIAENLRDEDFFPAIAVVNSVDPIQRQVISENRLQMESKNHSWSIVFFAERIDITYTYRGGEPFFTDLDSVMDKGKRLCELAFKAIADTTGTRIAVNGRFLIRDLTAEEKQNFIKKFVTVPKSCGDNPVTEWTIHINAPREIGYGEKKEKCNYIIDVYEIFGIDSNKPVQMISPRMAIGLDINTDATNTELKYGYRDLINLADASLSIMKLAIDEIEEDIK